MRLNRFLPWALMATFATLLLFFGMGVTTYQQRSSAEGWRARTYLVLLETGALRGCLAEAQTNLRGFLLTRDEKFVSRFEQYDDNFKSSLQLTQQLVDDNREQGIRTDRVQDLYRKWAGSARIQIAMRRRVGSTPDAGKRAIIDAQRQLQFQHGGALADRARALLHRIDEHERALLEERITAAAQLQARTEKIVFGGSVLGLGAMGVLAAMLLTNARELARAGQQLEAENTGRRRIENEIRIANESLSTQLARMEKRNHEIELLSECGQLLQACQTMDEAHNVITQMMPQLFPCASGMIYVFNASGNFLECAMSWQNLNDANAINANAINPNANAANGIAAPEQLQPDDCWALRCGQKHRYERGEASVACEHLSEPLPAVALCVPLLAQGSVLGLLHLRDQNQVSLDHSDRLLVLACAEQIGLAISNLQLRETLRQQSIRDPLTNLYNRRYLEESLNHELLRAARSRQSVGVIMMDIDFFKRFNDTHGHGAGDVLLQAVAQCLQSGTRGGDIACRYGGEELTVIMPDATHAQTAARAEELRCAIGRTRIEYHGQMLGPVTISAGVACFPEDAREADDLLKIADAALYSAKTSGRNRVVT